MTRVDAMRKGLAAWFDAHPDAAEHLRSIARGTYGVSCRLVEWLVAVHARDTGLFWYTDGKGAWRLAPDDEATELVDVHHEYRSQLRGATKTLFDPFRRHARTAYGDVETTVAQMNFVAWAHRRGVLRYALDHRERLLHEMAAPSPPSPVRDGGTRVVCFV